MEINLLFSSKLRISQFKYYPYVRRSICHWYIIRCNEWKIVVLKHAFGELVSFLESKCSETWSTVFVNSSIHLNLVLLLEPVLSVLGILSKHRCLSSHEAIELLSHLNVVFRKKRPPCRKRSPIQPDPSNVWIPTAPI